MAAIAALPSNDDGRLLRETARHLALWMSYEDTARVAALKTRASRFERVRGEARVQDGQVLAINEYMHPRLQEICETLPGGLGRWLMGSTLPRRLVERLTQKGRVIQTSSLRGYLMLRTVAAMKRWRRSTLRYRRGEPPHRGMAAAHRAIAAAQPRARGRSRAVPAPGQGLQRHPRARPAQLRHA